MQQTQRTEFLKLHLVSSGLVRRALQQSRAPDLSPGIKNVTFYFGSLHSHAPILMAFQSISICDLAIL